MRSFLLGVILGLAAFPVGMYVYFRNGRPPVAVADSPLPMERDIVRIPLETRLETEVQQVAPIEPTSANLAAGALIYKRDCAICHGVEGHPSQIAEHMYPPAPQLWEHHRNGAVGVSMDPPGETYWKIANGIRMTGMPAFGKLLNNTQIWQLTLLLSRTAGPPAEAAHLRRARGGLPDSQKATPKRHHEQAQAASAEEKD
jgi:thiosulfate dehydrogenase